MLHPDRGVLFGLSVVCDFFNASTYRRLAAIPADILTKRADTFVARLATTGGATSLGVTREYFNLGVSSIDTACAGFIPEELGDLGDLKDLGLLNNNLRGE